MDEQMTCKACWFVKPSSQAPLILLGQNHCFGVDREC